MQYWPLFFTGIVEAGILTWLCVKFFPQWGLLDYPERYGIKRSRLPYPGGLIFLFLTFAYFLLCQPSMSFLLGAILALGAVSLFDDRCPLPIWIRSLVHIGVALFVFYNGIAIEFIGNPFSGMGESFDLTQIPYLSLILTVLWIIIIQNALNWFDGIQGLSVGISGIGFLALGIFGLVRQEVSWEQGLPEFLETSFYLSGICLGAFLFFLRGRILLGDTGSQVLGFLLAVMSIFAGTKIATTLLVLGLPILDSIFVVFRRIFLEKKSPFEGDKKHLHHNLAHRAGEMQATMLLVLISALLASIGIFLVGMVKIISLIVVAIFIFGLDWWALGLKEGKREKN
ncbi:undecaprenyl/decaprenyl-phosphate alpha-N-acetylglucosaminyl 1-phosphate transferase [Candidatus Gracilibacteria bacterium]|nr:undecaprenyl/decaprenyl-phosphate alpha-N-acetylglucosaminyl 1-phosphate transferase [Candidatus Gracilibacteria bacterium]